MSKQSDGGPVFPATIHGTTEYSGQPTIDSYEGMSLRDYFAAHASEEDIRHHMPKTIGDVADLLVSLGWITKERRNADLSGCYDDSHIRRLRSWARYQHADAMLAARSEQIPDPLRETAPDLLEALADTLAETVECRTVLHESSVRPDGSYDEEFAADIARLDGIISRASAAITKATGQEGR